MIKMIPVVFGIDKSYVLQAFVVMHSILKNSKEQYHFIILTKDEIKKETDELVARLRTYYNNFSFTIKEINREMFSDVRIFHPRIREAAFYRLLIGKLVEEYDKCIYLDSDVLVNGDLRELYNIDLEEYYLAGVKDCHLFSDNSKITKHQRNLGIPSLEKYINSGVLVMNLKKMRDDNLIDIFIDQSKKDNLYEDQDVLNLCCYGYVKILPIKYNLFHFYMGKTIKMLFDLPYAKEDFMFDWNKPYILHMGGKFKPWVKRKYKGAEEWWQLAEIYHNSQSYNLCKDKYFIEGNDNKEIEKIFQLCQDNKVVIWGFSEQGKAVCDVFLKKGIDVFAFCDNDTKKKGAKYREIPVIDALSVIEMEYNIIWVISCIRAYKEVYGQLINFGVNNKNIVQFTYNNRGWMYYLSLAPEFYEEEIRTIVLCENDRKKMSDEQYMTYIQKIIDEADINNEEYRYLYSKYRFDIWLKC